MSLSARAMLHAGPHSESVRLVDLSLGGVGISSDSVPPIGSEVELEVDLADRTLALVGQVVRSQPGSFGLRFVRLDQRALVTILGVVAQA